MLYNKCSNSNGKRKINIPKKFPLAKNPFLSLEFERWTFMRTTPIVIGHRGARAFLPENTMPAFRLAFEQGAPGIEFDVHTSKDGIPVILHDATLSRTSNGKGYVSQWTLADLKKLDAGYCFDPEQNNSFPQRGKGFQIPTLEEMLSEFKTQKLCVEIKEQSAELTHKIIKLIQKYKAEDRVIVGSKYFEVSKTMKQNYSSIKRFLSKREFVMLFLDYKSGTKWSKKDSQAVASMPLEACGLAFGNKDFIDYLHEREITVYYWTINNPLVMKELQKRGADGIITDNPQLALKTIA